MRSLKKVMPPPWLCQPYGQLHFSLDLACFRQLKLDFEMTFTKKFQHSCARQKFLKADSDSRFSTSKINDDRVCSLVRLQHSVQNKSVITNVFKTLVYFHCLTCCIHFIMQLNIMNWKKARILMICQLLKGLCHRLRIFSAHNILTLDNVRNYEKMLHVSCQRVRDYGNDAYKWILKLVGFN